ncbi:unnamed protein product [Schistosoma turkestanicum]|nr:unnamed protein product [Schistosoma turkestanicum]
MMLISTINTKHLEYLYKDFRTVHQAFYNNNDQCINRSIQRMIGVYINPVNLLEYSQSNFSYDNEPIQRNTQHFFAQTNYPDNATFVRNQFQNCSIKNEYYCLRYDLETKQWKTYYHFKQRTPTFNQQMKITKSVNQSLTHHVFLTVKYPDKYYNKMSSNIPVENIQDQQLRHFYHSNFNQLNLFPTSHSSYHLAEHVDTASQMMLTSHFSQDQLKQLRDSQSKHSRILKNYLEQTIRNRIGNSSNNNTISTYTMNLNGHGHSVRMDQKRIFIIDHPPPPPSSSTISVPVTVNRSATSIHDIPHSLTSELLSNKGDKRGNGYNYDNNNNNNNPILSFQYVEPHTIELLVVVTESMKKQFGPFINEYLLSTMTTVSTLLRHPSLKTSIQLSIVDIILLDPIYARRHNLEDWLNSKQEQVMARFCKWVNRLRTPTYTWDSAILLNVGHFKSTALGVAHYRSMCNPESSCLAVLDRGFGTGHIIAHELGHQLGAKHDFELNSGCGLEEQNHHLADLPGKNNAHDLKLGTYPYYQPGDEWDYRDNYRNPDVHQYEFIRRDTIMSGTLYFDQFPLRWSACSRQAIHLFIESDAANCLRQLNSHTTFYSAEKLTSQSVDNRPGQIFSLDQQCEFVLKTKGTQFCGQVLPVCHQLYCQDSEHKSCLPMEAAWAEGTICGENKWCIQGQCVPTDENPTPLDGNWGEWGSWSQCSRSCGGGIQFSERECNNPEPRNGGNFCHGTRTRMRSCGNEVGFVIPIALYMCYTNF